MTAYHVGIDLHKSIAQVCVLDARGEVHCERRWESLAASGGSELVAWLADLGPSSRVAVEATGCNRWLVRACRRAGVDIRVVHASALGLKSSGRKTDRRDAREIARRLYLGDLDRHARSYFATEEEYGRRKLLRAEHKLVQMRTSLKGQIRGLLNAHLLRPPGGDLHGTKQIGWLRRQDLGEANQTLVLHTLAEALEAIQVRVAALKREIERQAKSDADTRWVQQLPQAGAQTALALKAELGDATRFTGARQVASFAGLAPRVNNSADRSHHGRITKKGNVELRWLMSQWAVRLLAFHDGVRRWAAPMRRRMHYNKVRMALARRLLVGVWVTFSRGEVFSLERCLGLRA